MKAFGGISRSICSGRPAPAKRGLQAEADELCDPDKIFSLCDADKGGTLDKFELRFALNAFGLYPTMEEVVCAMGDKTGVGRADFRALLADMLKQVPPEQRKPRAVPYARRGVSMGQLEDLNRTFVDSGWLQERIDEFNTAKAAEIARKEVFKLDINLYALDKFVIRPVTRPEEDEEEEDAGFHEVTATEAFDAHLRHMRRVAERGRSALSQRMRNEANLPQATHMCSYSELVNPKGIRVDFFVSHFWGHEFRDTMAALRLWSRRSFAPCGKKSLDGVVFWLCFLALNQHRVQDEVGETPEQGPFNAALAEAPSGIMVLDPTVAPFSRIWCLYEVFRFQTLRKDLDLVSGLGLVRELEDGEGEHSAEKLAYLQKVGAALKHLSAANSNSSSKDDQHAIWHRIMEKRYHNLKLETVLSQLRNSGFTENHFKTFDAKIRGMLAAPLFRASLSSRDLDNALRWMSLGARFGTRELEEVQAMGCDVPSVTIDVQRGRGAIAVWTLAHCAAFYGNEEGLRDLLSRKANPNASTNFGRTPLHFASTNSHLGVIDILVEHKADLEQTEQLGCTAVYIAALDGQLDVVKKLIGYGAAVNVTATKTKNSVLSQAAGFGFPDVVEELLLHRADPSLKGPALSPLHLAAENGHTAIVARLLEVKSEVDARTAYGETPLHRAAYGGSAEASFLLIAARADVKAREERYQESVMQKVAHSGCVPVLQALADHGVSVNEAQNGTLPPLAIAVKESKLEMVKAMLSWGAEVNSPGGADVAPLHVAASTGDAAAIQILLEARADIEAISAKSGLGFTPLYFACLGDHAAAFTALLDARADANARTTDQSSMLHSTAYTGSPAAAKLALASGLDVNEQEPKSGRTPLHIVLERMQALIVASSAESEESNKGAGKRSKGRGKGGKGMDRSAASKKKIESMVEVAKVFLHAGASCQIQNSAGDTAAGLLLKVEGAPGDELRAAFPAARLKGIS